MKTRVNTEDDLPVLTVNEFSGQRLQLPDGSDQMMFWTRDPERPDEGFCFTLHAAQCDDLLELLQQLKTSDAILVELHSVQPGDDEPTDERAD